jgi:hypothetical protein
MGETSINTCYISKPVKFSKISYLLTYIIFMKVVRELENGNENANINIWKNTQQQDNSMKSRNNVLSFTPVKSIKITSSSAKEKTSTENNSVNADVITNKVNALKLVPETSDLPPSYPGTSRRTDDKSKTLHPIATSRRDDDNKSDSTTLKLGTLTGATHTVGTSTTPSRPEVAAVTASSSSNMNRRVRPLNKPKEAPIVTDITNTKPTDDILEVTQKISTPSAVPKLDTHTDLIDAASTSMKHPDFILSEMVRALTYHGVTSKSIGRYSLRCTRAGVTFDMNISAFRNLDNVVVVNIKKSDGDGWTFKQLRAKLLATMRL